MFDLTGMVGVVTGASGGLDVQMAKALARQGANLAILSKNREKAETIAEEIRTYNVKCLPVYCDASSHVSIKEAVKTVLSEYGTVDILINYSRFGGAGLKGKDDDEIWPYTIGIDLSGAFQLAKEFGKVMIFKKFGRIINVVAMCGAIAKNELPSSSYYAEKAGIVNLTRSLASVWAKYDITVNTLCPGYFETPLTKTALASEHFLEYMNNFVPMKRYGMEGDLDSAIVFLAAKESSYITGITLPVDGGFAMMVHNTFDTITF